MSVANPAVSLTVIERLNQIDRPVKAKRLAEILGISHITLYKLAKQGSIPSIRIATAVRFDCRAIARWLKAAQA